MPKISIAQNILVANDITAKKIRGKIVEHQLRMLNIMSSAGAGKTTLLEATITRLQGRLKIGVIEGDVETSADAERIEAAGADTVQINTRGACHLEAHMVDDALQQLDLAHLGLLVVENIGNLICPADWDLGEDMRVTLVCTTEGDEKPSKYPHMFATSQVMVINKIDLLPYVNYDIDKVKRNALAINPQLRIFEVSSRTGEGLDTWCEWLMSFVPQNV